MKKIPFLIIFTLVFALFAGDIFAQSTAQPLKTFHDFTVKTIDGQDFNLATLKGKKILVVNTATQCGLTPQFAVLQKLYETLDTSKFVIIGFPANNFLEQDPGTNEEIYKWLTQKSLNGVLDTKIKWNFQKFLIDENGKLIGTLAPNVSEEINTIMQWLK